MARRLTDLDVLAEIRRAMRILRRAERYMTATERRARKSGHARAPTPDDATARRRANRPDLAEQA